MSLLIGSLARIAISLYSENSSGMYMHTNRSCWTLYPRRAAIVSLSCCVHTNYHYGVILLQFVCSVTTRESWSSRYSFKQ